MSLCAKFQFSHLSGWYFTDWSVKPNSSSLGNHFEWSIAQIELKFSTDAKSINNVIFQKFSFTRELRDFTDPALK